MLAFASMNCNLHLPLGNRNPVLPIELDHYTLLQTEIRPMARCIYDGNEAVQQRITSVPIRHDARLHNHIVNTIQGMVENHNPFAAAFKCIYGVDLQEYCKAEECREELPEVKKSLECIKNSQVQLQVD